MPNATCVFKCIGRILFSSLLLLQIGILAIKYLGYSNESAIGCVSLLAFPVLLIWFCCSKQLSKLWIVWTVYVVVMVIFIGMIFGTDVLGNIPDDSFWNQGTLKLTLCITPPIAVLMIFSASDSRDYVELVDQLCMKISLHLLDTIEILAITITPEKPPLSQFMIYFVAVFAALSLLLSPLDIAENKLLRPGKYKLRKKVYLFKLILMMVTNISLLITRAIAWLYFKREASLFITKNAITIGISFVEIMKCCKCFKDYRDCKYRRCRCSSDSEDSES